LNEQEPATGDKGNLEGEPTTALPILTTPVEATPQTYFAPPWRLLTTLGKTCETSNLACKTLGWTGSSNQVNGVCGESIVNGECQQLPVDFDTAEATCQAVGARLCTADELSADVTKSTGCDHLDGMYVWTRRPCSDTDAIASLATGATSQGGICVPKSSLFSFRCCGDETVKSACKVTPPPVELEETQPQPTTAKVPHSHICNPCRQGRGWNTDVGGTECCYKHFTHKNTFTDAQAECQMFGGSMLASITDRKEDAYVTSIRTGTKDVWIGGTRKMYGQKARINWLDGENGNKYANWYPTQPSVTQGNASNCVAAGSRSLKKTYGGIARWNDAVCSSKKEFVCKFCPADHVDCTSSTTITTSTSKTRTITTRTTTTTISTSTTTTGQCSTYTCGLNCHNEYPRCGWSTRIGACVEDAITHHTEFEEGDCDFFRKPTTPQISTPPTTPGMCSTDECDLVDPSKPCQCDQLCKVFGDCCPNFAAACSEGGRAGHANLDADTKWEDTNGIGWFVGGVSFGTASSDND
jgi:hypothetical protein